MDGALGCQHSFDSGEDERARVRAGGPGVIGKEPAAGDPLALSIITIDERLKKTFPHIPTVDNRMVPSQTTANISIIAPKYTQYHPEYVHPPKPLVKFYPLQNQG